MPRSPEWMSAAIVRNLPQRRGRSLQEWVGVLERGSGGSTHRVPLATPADVDDEMRAGRRRAYKEAAGP